MSEEHREITWDKIDLADPTDRSLITNISDALANLSAKKRAERKRQKLQGELVREYIETEIDGPHYYRRSQPDY